MAEDDHKIWSDEVQELTNATIGRIDAALEAKNKKK